MKLLPKIVWSDGMYLSPHHFQAQNRYFESSAHFITTSLWKNSYGLASYQLNEDSLRDGHVMLESACGIFEDGLSFDIPGSDGRPEFLDVASVFPPTADSVTVCLAISQWQPEGQNCSFEDGLVSNARYSGKTYMLHDENTGRDARPVRLAEKNIRLTISSEVAANTLTLPIARVKRDGAGHYVFDPTFVPPCIRLRSSRYLTGMLHRLVGILEDKSGSASRLNATSAAGFKAGVSGRQISQFWFLHAVNSGLSPLRHLLSSKDGHPEELFREMSRLAGALCTFGLDVHPSTLPDYDHEAPGACFAALDQHIRRHLDIAAPPEAVQIPLTQIDRYFYVGNIEDQRCFERSRWILGIHSKIGEAQLIEKTPQFVKICSGKFVSELVKRALPGLVLTHLSVPPSDISAKVDFQYFSVSRSGPCWEHIIRTQTIGIYIPGEIPSPEVECMVLMES